MARPTSAVANAVAKRRKPNPAERRRDLCDAAIQLLAADGAKGLSHLKVDRKAGVPDGTTSFYFRTRSALLSAVAERLAELDLATLQAIADSASDGESNPSPSRLAQVVFQAGNQPQLSWTRARYELTMQAARDPAMAAILQRAADEFTELHREILVQLMPHGAELESAVVEDLANVTLTFINGLLLRFVHGDRIIDSPEQLDWILSAIAAGILKSPRKGRLTDGGGPRPLRRRRAAGSGAHRPAVPEKTSGSGSAGRDFVTASTESHIRFDPYDVELIADPYPMFARLRDEAPLYYNAEFEFFALSRFADVNKALVDHATFSSARGAILELIKANLDIPSGMLIFEDPPIHDMHRKLLSRMFTPRKIDALEPMIREFCHQALDPLVGTGRFDFVTDLGAQMPMKVISALLGIPEDDQEYIRDRGNAQLRTEAGKPMRAAEQGLSVGEQFEAYIDWRAENPSDDIMTDLINVEFVDETGTTRRLTRDEILVYLNVVAGAGNETTTRLIGWAGKVLAEHPGQRRELAENPGLIPQAIEELLRYEPPAPHVSRYVTRDVTFYDQTVPEGTVMMMLIGAACRDPRQFGPDADEFDIHRPNRPHLTFGVGTHFCLGSALARLEGRIALEEILKRFPEWEVDLSNATLSPTSTVRGWESLPALVPR